MPLDCLDQARFTTKLDKFLFRLKLGYFTSIVVKDNSLNKCIVGGIACSADEWVLATCYGIAYLLDDGLSSFAFLVGPDIGISGILNVVGIAPGHSHLIFIKTNCNLTVFYKILFSWRVTVKFRRIAARRGAGAHQSK